MQQRRRPPGGNPEAVIIHIKAVPTGPGQFQMNIRCPMNDQAGKDNTLKIMHDAMKVIIDFRPRGLCLPNGEQAGPILLRPPEEDAPPEEPPAEGPQKPEE